MQELQDENGDVVSRLEKEYFTEAYAAWWAQDDDAGVGEVSFDGPKRMLTERFGESIPPCLLEKKCSVRLIHCRVFRSDRGHRSGGYHQPERAERAKGRGG